MRFATICTAALIVLAACSQEEEDPSDGDEEVFPTRVHTGYDGGQHTYRVPVAIHGAKGTDVTWTAKDPDLVDLEPETEGVMITARRPGRTTITAKYGSFTETIDVNIAQYSPADWAAGDMVYNNTVKCISCHGRGTNAPNHSPSEIGKHEDSELQRRITTGESLHGEAPTANHDFGARGILNPDQIRGAIAYIRALQPKDWPSEEHDHHLQ